jgi:hypothetical protein
MGGMVGTIVLYVIATGKPSVELPQIAIYPVTRSVCLRGWRICQVVLTFMCLIAILAVADNAGKRDLPIGGAVPDGLVDSVLSKSAAAEPWPSSLLLDWRGGK